MGDNVLVVGCYLWVHVLKSLNVTEHHTKYVDSDFATP